MSKARNADEANHGNFSNRERKSLGESYDAEFKGYINLTLSDAQKSSYPQWVASAAFPRQLEGFTADGINFSLKIEPKGGGFLASATQRRVGSPNAGYCVTARAKDAVTALGRCVYCVTILSRAERWTDVQDVANPDRW